jgi:hypothetical protein
MAFGTAHAADMVSCFNGGAKPSETINVWVFEGQTDLQKARAAGGPMLVFSVPQGAKEQDRKAMRYCFYNTAFNEKMGEKELSKNTLLCRGGTVKIDALVPGKSLTGEYRLTFDKGLVKAEKFNASFCPERKPAAKG